MGNHLNRCFSHTLLIPDLKHLDSQRRVTANSDAISLFPQVGKGKKWESEWKQMERYSLQRVIFICTPFIFFSQTAWRDSLHILTMYLNLQWSYTWSQVVQDWQRDWLREKARQIVILPTKLTLSSERLRFLGKSQSACCPVSPLPLAQVCGQMTEWGKMESSHLVQREREACDWSLGCLCDCHYLHPPLVRSDFL